MQTNSYTICRRLRQRESGSTLLEALVSILIFSIGVLAIVGLQAASMRASADAKYRSVANLLADELIGQMWATDRTPATITAQFAGTGGSAGTGGAAYLAWAARVEGALAFPDAAAYKPSVTVTTVGAASQVVINIFWLAPGEDGSAGGHKHRVVTTLQ